MLVLISAEEADLFSDLHSLTRNSTLRKLNDLIKRAKLAKVKHVTSVAMKILLSLEAKTI